MSGLREEKNDGNVCVGGARGSLLLVMRRYSFICLLFYFNWSREVDMDNHCEL